MEIRQATEDDLPGYARVQEVEWSGSVIAGTEQLMSRHKWFPEGVLVALVDGKVVAGTTFVRLPNYNIDDGLSWGELTDDGWCSNHTPDGRIMFGVDMSISRSAPRSTSVRMFHKAGVLAAKQGVDAVYWGSRMPRYYRHADTMSAIEYATTRNKRGRLLDPELEIYSWVPGAEFVGVTANYFPDPESMDYGAILRWPNPLNRYKILSPLADLILTIQSRKHRPHQDRLRQANVEGRSDH